MDYDPVSPWEWADMGGHLNALLVRFGLSCSMCRVYAVIPPHGRSGMRTAFELPACHGWRNMCIAGSRDMDCPD